MNQDLFQQLLQKYRDGTATAAEKELFLQVAAQYENLLSSQLDQDFHNHQLPELGDDTTREIIYNAIQLRAPERQLRTAPRLPVLIRYTAAAAILLAVLAGAWLFTRKQNRPENGGAVTTGTSAIQPAGDKAILTLANGQQIVLDSTGSGAITEANGVRIIRLGNGQLAYKAMDNKRPASLYNTLTTPRGGQYKIQLPDGSTVWMNSASSLTYPTVFNEKERLVKLTGEAYFEVAPHAGQPFKVTVKNTTVDVLGTGFNIHAYSDEPAVTTTLVEGSVRVSQLIQGTVKADVLTPGLQAVGTDNNQLTRKANLRQVLSWKNGLFIFEDRKLAEVLREISRWYDIDIDMQAPPDDTRYGGVINRNSPLAHVLNLLESNGIRHFKTEGRKLIVLP